MRRIILILISKHDSPGSKTLASKFFLSLNSNNFQVIRHVEILNKIKITLIRLLVAQVGLNLIDEKSGGRKSRRAVPLSTVQNVCIILNDF